MISNDGVALTSVSHPRPSWWKRPWSWLLTRRDIRRSALVEAEITILVDDGGRPVDSTRSILIRSRRTPMDIEADLAGAIKRVEDLARNIFENGAPHQKPHGADLAAVVQAAKGPAAPVDTSDLEAQLVIVKGNLTAEMAKTDAATAQVTTLTAELAAANARITVLEQPVVLAQSGAESVAAAAPLTPPPAPAV
jgi:hypothetical protein